MTSNTCDLASFACERASFITSKLMLFTFMSSCIAVTPSEVPATLKSISPTWSSNPCMSVKVTYSPSSPVISPTDIPATGDVIGTPASIRAKVPAQTLPMEVLPFELRASHTILIV